MSPDSPVIEEDKKFIAETQAAVEKAEEEDAPLQMVEIDGKMLPVTIGPDGKKQAVDENGNTYILAEKKLSAIELKRQKIWKERYQRLANKGIDPKKIPIMLAEEDYKNKPLADKFEESKKLNTAITRRLAQDINGLQHNDVVLADSMDVNFRAFAKMLLKLGLSLEDQKTIIQETEKEIAEERQKRIEEARLAAAARAQKAQEKKAVEELNKPEGVAPLDPAATPAESAPSPEGATVFGG